MTISIDPVEPQNIYSIIALQARIWEKASGPYLAQEQMDYMFGRFYSPEALKNDISAGQNYFILHEDSVAKGFVSHSALDKENGYKLNKIFILPENQGKGFGQKLLENVIETATNKNAEFLELYVNRKNQACSFYKKNGFDIIEEMDIAVGPYFMNDYRMRKILAK